MSCFGLFGLPQIIRSFKYRDRGEIVCDILTTCKSSQEGRKKTQIMQSANLNYIQTRKYLGFMTNCGYISITQKETYVITAEGSKYLQMIQIQELTRMR
ncbi:hypothetical protein A3K79_07385 [Candidatus Bathyarchaeota archaeon RBG_13_46_16b]|nr:MAG: hypothetical protein A3K79_07385 [Candidatus Bathyarchaeota archaeon RBG_13_46_16b]